MYQISHIAFSFFEDNSCPDKHYEMLHFKKDVAFSDFRKKL